ncbi:MAG: hypothetical protein RSA94_03700 [Mucinivorans sp.]
MKTNQYIIACAALMLCLMQSCVKEHIYEIPMVELTTNIIENKSNVSSSDFGASYAQGIHQKAATTSICYYLYPNFDYKAEPIIVHSESGIAHVALLPGKYGVLLHNEPIAPLVVSGQDTIVNLGVGLPFDANGALPPCPVLYALGVSDTMRQISVLLNSPNVLAFVPEVVSKKLRVVVNTDKFGEITAARATLSGVASALNFNTLKPSSGVMVGMPNFTVEGNRLRSPTLNLLGFSTSNLDTTVLTLYVKNKEVDFELEQPVDLSSYIKDMVGSDIELTLTVSFDPDVRVYPVEIRQWDSKGNEIEVGFV